MTALADYLLFWRTTVARDREIVEAVVRPEHQGPSPGLRDALAAWPGVWYWGPGRDADRLVLIRPLVTPQRERWWLHGLLFAVTFVTMWMGGALLLDVEAHTLPFLGWGWQQPGLVEWLRRSVVGIPFAMALMAILLSHEMGHYLTAKRYGINASPPYFLPAPIEFNFIGTFGAFIRLRSPVVDRRQLLDIGAAGPWVGFLVAVLMLLVGLQHSAIVPGGADAMVINAWDRTFVLGDSLLTDWARTLLIGDTGIELHPLAFAGWVGLLVTTLNLLPLSQLDGGHIVYALVGRWQPLCGWLTWFGLIGLGYWQWGSGVGQWWWWWVWALLILLMGGGRLSHPQVLERARPLPRNRVPLGIASIALFVLTFAPVPIQVI